MLLPVNIPNNDTSTTILKANIEFVIHNCCTDYLDKLNIVDNSCTSLNNDDFKFEREDNEDYDDDYDVISPLHIKKSFKIKVKIRSITKFSPRPVLD